MNNDSETRLGFEPLVGRFPDLVQTALATNQSPFTLLVDLADVAQLSRGERQRARAALHQHLWERRHKLPWRIDAPNDKPSRSRTGTEHEMKDNTDSADPAECAIMPCPFTHRRAVGSVRVGNYSFAQISVFQVTCECGARGPNASTPEGAILRWNSLCRCGC